MASAPSNFILDADLHGLVDGHIEPERRGEALRRLAGSPENRARVEAWQEQNTLLRRAFSGVDREPLPAILDLSAKPRLQCVAANDSPLVGEGNGLSPAAPWRGLFGFAVAMMLLVTAGVGVAWMILNPTGPDDVAFTALRGSVDATLASRVTDAIGKSPEAPAAPPLAEGDRMPTTRIPDLRGAGFSFVSAEMEPSNPASILFRYQGGAHDRLVVSVAHAAAQDGTRTAPVRMGNAYSWRRRDQAFSIAGTLSLGRLRAMALAMQNDETQN